MKINGLLKLTLLDYPGKTAATVFLAGCNYRCPFCHNSDLVLPGQRVEQISEEDFLTFLSKRRGLLDGVCVTGGEPTMRPDLPGFLSAVKQLGFEVKLDTNGSNPAMLRQLLQDSLVDRIAMDIKNSPEKYALTAGIPGLLNDSILAKVRESAALIMDSGIEYEFRTTAVRELHTAEDFRAIGEWLRGAESYFIQNFEDAGKVITGGLSGFTSQELEAFKEIMLQYVNEVGIRGTD